MKITVGVGLTL